MPTSQVLQAALELKLRQSHIQISDDADLFKAGANKPVGYFLESRLKWVLGPNGLYAVSMELTLSTSAPPPNNPKATQGSLVLWGEDELWVLSKDVLSSKVKMLFDGMFERFCNDYFKANPQGSTSRHSG